MSGDDPEALGMPEEQRERMLRRLRDIAARQARSRSAAQADMILDAETEIRKLTGESREHHRGRLRQGHGPGRPGPDQRRDRGEDRGVQADCLADAQRPVEPPAGPSMPLLGRSPLTGVIEDYMDQGWSLDELTVLARDNDPFRQDRAEGHRLGRWLRDTLEAMGVRGRRGRPEGPQQGPALHAHRSGQAGRPEYENDEATWKWLTDRVCKAARWLGYVPFDQVTDQRNAEPVIRNLPAAARGADPRCTSSDEHGAGRGGLRPAGAPGRRRRHPGRTGWPSSARKARWSPCSARSRRSSAPTCTCRPGRSATRSCTRWRAGRPPSSGP